MNIMQAKARRPFGEPTMSDRTILISVEDLICGAFGSFDDNTVNFQQVQTILGILARQMRMLKQDVEIRFDDLGIDFKTLGEMDSRERMGTGRGVARVGSIEVVTASQFALLEESVRNLEEATGPLPTPSMPDNQKLREELAKGRATLAEAMKAMQITARVKAAEKGLARMAGLLSQLAAVGLLPMELVDNVEKMRADLLGAARKARVERLELQGQSEDEALESEEEEEEPGDATYEEMEQLIEYTKDEFSKDIKEYLAYAEDAADNAAHASKNVSEKMEVIMKMNNRISTLYSKNADYAVQLDGFDSGLMSQLASFQEQMGSMRTNLVVGLKLYELANNTAGSTAIMDLNERYEDVLQELKNTIYQQKALDISHSRICDDLMNLLKCVEILREDKADSDEVNDGLRDKADLTRIVGMLKETDFAKARIKLEQRIAKSYNQFKKLDTVWQKVLKDLMVTVERKAELISLIGLTQSTEKQLTKVQEELLNLEIMLGEPRAAFLVRKIAMDGTCLTRAVIEHKHRKYGMPLPGPPKRPPPAEPCLADMALPLVASDHREHICHRWVGGSHTLMPNTVAREKASLIKLQLTPTKKYTGYGNDGRLYMMEEDMQPCAECNRMDPAHPGNVTPQVSTPTRGGGDQACY